MQTVAGSIRLVVLGLLAILLFIGVWFFFFRDQNAGDRNEQLPTSVTVGGAPTKIEQSIHKNLKLSKDHTTFMTVMNLAGLAPVLESNGPLTVLAPNNIAFGKLPRASLETLLKPEYQSRLADLLKYHIVPGKYTTADFTEGMKLKTVQGQELLFSKKDGAWWINGTIRVETADILSYNGVVHSIDSVLTSGTEQ